MGFMETWLFLLVPTNQLCLIGLQQGAKHENKEDMREEVFSKVSQLWTSMTNGNGTIESKNDHGLKSLSSSMNYE